MKTLTIFFLMLLAAGCELLEEDISDKKVPVIAPADRWAAVEYAAGYEFTVVSPSFSAAGRVVADTVIYADTLVRRFVCRLTLAEGEYEWSVAGFNGGYRTRVEVRSLTVLPAGNPEQPEKP